MTRSGRVLGIGLGVVFAACQPGSGEHAASIVGGILDPGDPAVVALTTRARTCGEVPHAACTGALIGPRAVLTAAHCVVDQSASALLVVSGGQVEGGATHEIDEIVVHPRYDGVASDLAILVLAVPMTTPPLEVRTAPLDGAQLGAAVRVVGFGAADDGAGDAKREGRARITKLTATTLVIEPDPALPCNADSGGPVLIADAGGVEQVAGVVAYGDPGCMLTGTSTRIDAYGEFVATELARIAAAAPAARPALEPGATLCTGACEIDADCPPGTDCIDGRCALLGIDHGALGATCTSEATCGGAPCLAGVEATACRCLATCDALSDDGCGCGAGRDPGGAMLLAGIAAVIVARRRR